MEASGLILGILQYAGLYFQFNAGLNDVKMDNHVSGNDMQSQCPSGAGIPEDFNEKEKTDEPTLCTQRPTGKSKKKQTNKGTPTHSPSLLTVHGFTQDHPDMMSQEPSGAEWSKESNGKDKTDMDQQDLTSKKFNRKIWSKSGKEAVWQQLALFIEVPSDITTHSGEDVEMACSFRGAGSTSYSLEIQWWYSRKRRDQQDFTSYATNNVGTLEEMSKDATKISVVKVAGSNISHKLRLTRVKPTDEGTYECHVIDHSGLVVQRYRVQAYLQVAPERSLELEPEHVSQQRSALPTGSRDVGGESSWQHL